MTTTTRLALLSLAGLLAAGSVPAASGAAGSTGEEKKAPELR